VPIEVKRLLDIGTTVLGILFLKTIFTVPSGELALNLEERSQRIIFLIMNCLGERERGLATGSL